MIAVLGLSVVKISTNYLGTEGYGEYVLVYEFLAFFGIAADLGIFTIAVREMSKNEDQIPKIIGNVLSLRTFLALVMMILASLAVFLIPQYASTRVPLGVSIASVTIFLTILNGTISSVLQTKLKMHLASLSMVLGKAVSVGFMVYVVFIGYPKDVETGFYMLVFAGVLGGIFTLAQTSYYVRKITGLTYRFDWDVWKNVFIKALPYGLALILNTVYFRIDSLLISLIKGQEQVGIYGVAMRMLENFAILPLYFMNSVLPVLTKAIEEKKEKYKEIIQYAFNFLAALSFPMVVGGVVLAYPIIFIISTPEFLSVVSEGYYGSDTALKILIFALLFQFLNVLFAFILIAMNKQSKLLYINAACVVFNIVTNIIFIPTYGFRGAAVTSVLSEFFILIWTYILAKKYLTFSLDFKNLFKILVAALVMGLAVYLALPVSYNFVLPFTGGIKLQNWNVPFLVIFGAIIYVGMLVALGVVNKKMVKMLKKEDGPVI